MNYEIRSLYVYMLKCDARVTSVTQEEDTYVIRLKVRKNIRFPGFASNHHMWLEGVIRLTPGSKHV